MDVELLPYRRIMRHFRNAIMVAHIAVDSLAEEPGIPATCSKEIVAGLLNRDLDFGGLVITDALIMEGYTAKFGIEEALKRTILAGHDLLLYPLDPMEVLRKLIGLVQEDVLPMKLIDHSVRKILAWKEVLGLLHDTGKPCIIEHGMDIEKSDLGHKTLERALTLIRDTESLVPLPETSHLLVVTTDDDGPDPAPYSERPDTGLVLSETVSETRDAVDTLSFTPELTDDEVESLLGITQNYGTAIIGVYATPRAWADRGVISDRAAAVLKEINKLVGRTVVIIFGNPYIFHLCEGAETVLCIYDNSETAERVAADALLGRITIKGKLPVTLSEEFPRGFGLKR
jgi:beta-glucosidase-like glycosyl hydrolase